MRDVSLKDALRLQDMFEVDSEDWHLMGAIWNGARSAGGKNKTLTKENTALKARVVELEGDVEAWKRSDGLWSEKAREAEARVVELEAMLRERPPNITRKITGTHQSFATFYPHDDTSHLSEDVEEVAEFKCLGIKDGGKLRMSWRPSFGNKYSELLGTVVFSIKQYVDGQEVNDGTVARESSGDIVAFEFDVMPGLSTLEVWRMAADPRDTLRCDVILDTPTIV